jgi:ABC-2 type transport system ATP-binding protein
MVEAHDLTRKFRDFTAVDRVSLRVPAGALVALLGPNGAGKTTIVRMLAGLIAPTQGEATVAGHDIRREAGAVRATVGLVTDAPGLYEQMTAPSYLDFFGKLYGVPDSDRSRRIPDLLALFELEGFQGERMVGFSKGMKQKVALARALLHDPAVLFLDEPTSGLDPLAARGVRDLIQNLKRSNRAVVLCTHDLDEAERLADEVAILRQGRIVASGTPSALRAHAEGDTRVRVVLAASMPSAPPVLQTIAGISGIESDSRDGPTVRYRTAEPERVNPEVIAQLVAAGARIVSVTCETSSLEDVYASIQRRGQSAPSGAVVAIPEE